MKLRFFSPRSARAADVYTIRRAASIFIAMSAIMNSMPWKLLMDLPNCLRSLTYSMALSRCALRDADGLRADGGAGVVEGLQCGLEAGALVADDAVGGDGAVLEVEFGGRRALDAELLLQRSDGEAGSSLMDHERGDAVGALIGVGDGHDGVPGGFAAVGDPALAAVDHPVVAVEAGTGLHRRGIGACFTFGKCVGGHRLTRGDGRQDLPLEVVGAVEDQAHRAELVDGRDQRRRRAHAETSSMTMQVATESAP